MTSYRYNSGGPRRSRGLFGRLWAAITWPFRKIEQVETDITSWAQHKRKRFRHRYRHSKVIAPLVETLVWLLLLPLRLVWWAISLPFRLIGGTTRQVQQVRRRELVHLLQGLPAAIAAICLFVVLMKLVVQADDLPRDYLIEAQAAYNDGQFELAKVYLQRVLQLNAATDDASFLLARTLEQSGHPRRALAILDSLAPDDRQGDPRAHYRKADLQFQEVLALFNDSDPQTNPTNEQVEVLRHHLRHSASGSFSPHEEANIAYFEGVIYLIKDDPDAALPYLERASQVRKDLNFDLASFYTQLDRPGKAQQKRELARVYLQQKLSEDSGDRQSRLRLASVLVDDGEFDAATSVLQMGIRDQPDEQLRQALAIVCVRRYTALPAETSATARMALLQQALELDPQCASAFVHLMRFSGGQAEAAGELLQQMIAVGASAPLAHFALGMRAWNEHDTKTARWHLGRAYHLDSSFARIGNNFAWFLAHDKDNPDPEQALEVINAVLASVPESHPDRLAFVETRGQIYVLLEQWPEALDDLELALQVYNRNIKLHQSLAMVYEKLGQPALATMHTNVATNLKRLERQSQ